MDPQRPPARQDTPAGLSDSDFMIDPDMNFHNSLPLQLLQDWQRKRNGDRLPGRQQFGMENLRPYLGWLCLLRVNPDRRDLVYSLIGTRIVEQVGRDNTGRAVSETLPPAALEIYMQLLEQPEPLRTWGQVTWRNRDYLHHESLLLPLASDGFRIDQFMVMMMFY